MRVIFLVLIIFSFFSQSKAEDTEKIIIKFQKIQNLNFNFIQDINGNIEEGNCIIEYPKKIYCKYNTTNNKILVSNGKSIVIKTDIGSYYRYPLKNTALNLILDKNFLLSKIKELKKNIIDDKFINFSFREDEIKINIFFHKNSLNIAGWKTLDVYQNLSFTSLHNIIINQEIKTEIFELPKPN